MTENYLKGLEACQRGNFEEGIRLLGIAILENPLHIEAFYNRGLAYLQIDKVSQAFDDFDRAVGLAPFTADIYSQRGVALHLLGKSERALEDFDKALSLDPQNAYRYSSRAFVKAKLGDIFGAIEDYETCIKLDPEDAIALNNLGLLEQQLGYKESSQQRFAQADAIADQGKIFDKPDIKKILAEHRSSKTVTVAQHHLPTNSDNNRQPTYWTIVKDIFTKKEVFNEFIGFWKNKIKSIFTKSA